MCSAAPGQDWVPEACADSVKGQGRAPSSGHPVLPGELNPQVPLGWAQPFLPRGLLPAEEPVNLDLPRLPSPGSGPVAEDEAPLAWEWGGRRQSWTLPCRRPRQEAAGGWGPGAAPASFWELHGLHPEHTHHARLTPCTRHTRTEHAHTCTRLLWNQVHRGEDKCNINCEIMLKE